jgi:hypothetical protein
MIGGYLVVIVLDQISIVRLITIAYLVLDGTGLEK